MNEKPWVKINSETYVDCIVGNKAGLNALKSSIDQALIEENSKVEALLKADFNSVVLTDDKWDETESTEAPWWQVLSFKALLGLWLVLLPAYALYKLVIE
ncbi:MAG: hypothetical protein ACSHW0_18835 [Thalassotalea sp.]|jgi:hypothetical protein